MRGITNFFRRIGTDIANGENLDLYVTITIAILLSISSIIGITGTDKIAGVTLAVLTLITISTLISRHRIEDLSSKLYPSIDTIFVDEFMNEIDEDLETASDVWLIGASLDGIAKQYFSILEKKLKGGHTVRLLITNPNRHDVLEISEMRAYINPSVSRAQAQTKATLDDFCELKKLAPEKLLIRTIDFPIQHRAFMLNPESRLGKIYVSYYPFKTPRGSLPKFVINARETQWFNHFKQETKNLWNAGKDWNCS